ncbi:hypothetical protein ACHAW6_008961 [Cyclotella cf. meneghiniana]
MHTSIATTSQWLAFVIHASIVTAHEVVAFAPTRRHRLGHASPNSAALFSNRYYNDFDDLPSPRSTSATEDPLITSLRNRQLEIEESSTKLPLVIIDSMLPRQVLDIQLSHSTLKNLLRHRMVEMESPTLGMLGMIRTAKGFVPLTNGVEVQIVKCGEAASVPRDTTGGGEEAWDVTLKATRRFALAGGVEKTVGGWTESRVEFLDSGTEIEWLLNQSGRGGEDSDGSRLSLARAVSKCSQFTQPNRNLPDNLSIIDRWIQLAKQNERYPKQISTLLDQLGPIPPEGEPSERAFWIGALINPLPALGVAMEIRPRLLMAKGAEERVDVALEGIWGSIKHMDGSARLW